MMYILVIAGFALLFGGAEVMVRGAVMIAGKFGVSPLIIGMTVVAMGTSAPELLVSLNAALDGASAIAIGNVVGSNIANALLIMGVAGLIAPIATKADPRSKDKVALMGGTLLFIAGSLLGVIDRMAGGVLLIAFLAFLYYSYRREKAEPEAGEHHIQEVKELGSSSRPAWMAWAMLFAGLAALLWGADMLVGGGVSIARAYGVPEDVIGLTMIALGTSLPELAASAVAARRNHAEVALGNVVGSNLFNVLFVTGLVALVAPLAISSQILTFDIWVMLGATAILLPFMGTGRTFTRMYGGIFVILYVAYIAVQAYGVSDLARAVFGS